MYRWSETHAEDVKFAGFIDFLEDFAAKPVILRLVNGTVLQGTFLPGGSGNNGGNGPRGWAYYGGIVFSTNDGEEIDVDYLDVDVAMLVDSTKD